METQKHISDPEATLNQILKCSGYFSVLNEEDREYVQVARFALEEQSEWNV